MSDHVGYKNGVRLIFSTISRLLFNSRDKEFSCKEFCFNNVIFGKPHLVYNAMYINDYNEFKPMNSF